MGMFQTRGSNERYGVLESSVQRTIAATGTNQATGALIGANVTIVTGGNGTVGVTLRQSKTNSQSYTGMVFNSSGSALLIYPPLGGNINNGTTNASLSLASNKTALFASTIGNQLNFIANISA